MNRAATVRERRPPQARFSAVKPDRFLTGAARIKPFILAPQGVRLNAPNTTLPMSWLAIVLIKSFATLARSIVQLPA